jgi:2-C-methyl-D-erythritol 4-phosphate cytidylyltransferase
MKYYAIIVAGGTGNRMQNSIPKQFLPLAGKPVLMHSIQAFFVSKYQPDIIVVLNRTLNAEWKELCSRHNFTIPHQITDGGTTRYESVKNGLKLVRENSLIAIHDAARPLLSSSLIETCYEQALEHGNAIPAVQSSDSIRQLRNGISVTLDREEIYRIQTPQTFRSELLLNAFKQPFDAAFTDDASVIEKGGNKIHLVSGDSSNIKITYPEDVLIAETLIKNRSKKKTLPGL